MQSPWLHRTIAVARVVVAVFFLLFGEYKLFGASSGVWVAKGFPDYLHGYVNGGAVPFYRSFLEIAVVPYANVWPYIVGVCELAIGVSLALGLWVRYAAIGGILFMLNLLLSTWFAGGHPADWWRYIGGQLDNLSLILLFLIFAVAASSDPWALDRAFGGRRRRRR